MLGQATPPADALARALQERYRGIRDFAADFVHTYRGGVLRTQTPERGTVKIKKPGRMRWVYANPEKKEFVSDGQKVYSYFPADRQVIVSAMPSDDQATTPALFLAGKGDIARDFTRRRHAEPGARDHGAEADAPAAGTGVRVPGRGHRPATLQIRALTTRDRQGGESTLTSTNLKENQGISDKEFVFRIPRGVDVITDGTRN